MKLINKRWYDERGNSWATEKYCKEYAEKLSKTLINCGDCRDCSNCFYCSDCRDCSNCFNCNDCSYCHDCSYCNDCHGCHGCKSQPKIYMTERIGSRKTSTVFYKSVEQSECQVTCGCFSGSLAEFEKRVAEVHGDNEHGKAYAEAIKTAQIVFGLGKAFEKEPVKHEVDRNN